MLFIFIIVLILKKVIFTMLKSGKNVNLDIKIQYLKKKFVNLD